MKNSLQRLSESSDIAGKSFSKMENILVKGLGFLGVTLAIDAAIDSMAAFEDQLVSLANTTGSLEIAKNINSWVDSLTMKLPVARDELLELSKIYSRLGGDVRRLDIESLTAASLGLGMDIGSLESQFRDLSYQVRFTYDDFLSLNQQFGITQKEYSQMQKAIQGTTRGSIDRVNALLGVLGGKYADTIARTQDTINFKFKQLQVIGFKLKEAFFGDPGTGMMRTVKDGLQGIIDFYNRNEKKIVRVVETIGRVVQILFGWVSQIFSTIATASEKFFETNRRGMDDFTRNVILPVVTFAEIIFAKFLVILDGFVRGFLGSPLWGYFSKALGIIVVGFREILIFLGLISRDGRDATKVLGDIGYWIGVIFSAMVIRKIVVMSGLMKALAFGIKGVSFAVGLLSKAMMFLAANPIGLVIVAVGLLITGIVLLWRNWDQVTSWVKRVFVGAMVMVREEIMAVVNGFKNWYNVVKKLFQGDFKGAFESFKKYLSDWYDWFKNRFEKIGKFFSSIVRGFKQALGFTTSALPEPTTPTPSNTPTSAPVQYNPPTYTVAPDVSNATIQNLSKKRSTNINTEVSDVSPSSVKGSDGSGDIHLHLNGYIQGEEELVKLIYPVLENYSRKRKLKFQ